MKSFAPCTYIIGTKRLSHYWVVVICSFSFLPVSLHIAFVTGSNKFFNLTGSNKSFGFTSSSTSQVLRLVYRFHSKWTIIVVKLSSSSSYHRRQAIIVIRLSSSSDYHRRLLLLPVRNQQGVMRMMDHYFSYSLFIKLSSFILLFHTPPYLKNRIV